MFDRLRFRADELIESLRALRVRALDRLAEKPDLDELESRILFSAAPLAIVATAAEAPDGCDCGSLSSEYQESISESSAASADQFKSTREIVFIDETISDKDHLLDDLRKHNPSIDVFLLDDSKDGIQQITETLQSLTNIDAVHIVSHGVNGQLKLGDVWLHSDNLAAYAGEVATWGGSLSSEADLLMYGCDLAGSSKGQLLVESLSALTGADVAASVDDTGHARYSGDWSLEFTSGTVTTQVAFSGELQQNWLGKLSVLDVTQTADVVNGDTSSVAALTNAGGDGGDGISLREAILAINNDTPGHTIRLDAGSYILSGSVTNEDLAVDGDLDILKDVFITGVDANLTTIDASGLNERVFEVFAGATLDISDVTITGGNASGDDGGAAKVSGSLVANRVAFIGNAATNGGAIYTTGSVTLTDTILNQNSAIGQGGGLQTSGAATTTLDRVEVSFNTANQGGGIYQNANSLDLSNVTLSSNSSVGAGSAIYTRDVISVTNSTIAFNTGGNAIQTQGVGTATLRNTILHNPLVNNASTTLTTLGFNIDSDGSAGLAGTGDLNNVDPRLDSLLNNGGFGRTHALLGNSIALNAGANQGATATDQRGEYRDSLPDIGAFESSTGGTMIYWAETGANAIYRSNTDGSGVQQVLSGLGAPKGLDVDVDGGKIYWIDTSTSTLHRANLDGTGRENFASAELVNPMGIGLDLVNEHIYVADDGGGADDAIRRYTLDGIFAGNVVENLNGEINDVAADSANGLLYFADGGNGTFDGEIWEVAMTGGTPTAIVTGQPGPASLALDLSADRVYWADDGDLSFNTIKSASLGGGGTDTVSSSNLDSPLGVAIDDVSGKLYWTDSANDFIRRSELDGSAATDVALGLSAPGEIAVVTVGNGSPASVSLSPTQDTYLNSDDPDSNYGASTTLVVDESGGGLGDQHPILQFDLSSIPSSATITSATLSLEVDSRTGSGIITLDVFRVTESWNEGNLDGVDGTPNWKERSPGTSWSTQGGTVEATEYASLKTSSTGEHVWDITSLVIGWATGELTNDGLLIAGTETGSDTVTYFSRESATPPQLQITYLEAPNTAPTDVTPSTFTIDEHIDTTGGYSLGNLSAVDPDPGDTFTWTKLTGGDETVFTLNPTTGELTLDDGVLDHETKDTYTVNVRVTDSASNTFDDTITLNVGDLNDQPTVANPITDQVATEDSPFSFQFAADTFDDADGDMLTYTASLDDGSLLPSWLTFTPATRTFGGTPQNADVGTILVRVTADDGNGGSEQDVFQITVSNTNDAPTLTTLTSPVVSTTEDTEVAITFTDLALAGDENDIDGTVDSFVVKAVNSGSLKIGATASTATAWTLGTNDTIDTTNSAYWTPDSNATGTQNAFAVVARDDGGLESATNISAQIDVTPENDAPVLADENVTLTSINENDFTSNGDTIAAIVVDGSITDADGAAVESIALIGADDSNGTWQFSVNDGSTWNDVNDGSLADGHALLLDGTLSGASTQKLRFVPNAAFNGMAALTFRAWDQTGGTAGTYVDASSNGGISAFSVETDQATITITPSDVVTIARETIDNDADGQIDHIKITTNKNLNDDFSGLGISVAGYTLDPTTPFATSLSAGGDNDNVFYVRLIESGTPDSGVTPTVTISSNTSVTEFGGGGTLTVDAAGETPIDSASPVLIYATSPQVNGTTLFRITGHESSFTFSESLSGLPNEADLEGALLFASGAIDGDNVPSTGTGANPISFSTTNYTNDTILVELKTDNTLNTNGLLVGTHTVQVIDGSNLTDAAGNTANTSSAEVIVGDINDPPTLTASTTTSTFTEDGPAVTLFSDASADTIELWQSFSALTITVTQVTDGSNEALNTEGSSIELVDGNSGSTTNFSYLVNVVGTTATVNFTGGSANITEIETLIDTISYQNNSDNPTIGNRVVSITELTDSGGTAGGGDDTAVLSISSTVSVVGVNDAPEIAGGPFSFTPTDEDTPSAGTPVSDILMGIAASDADADELGLAVTSPTGNGTWQFSTDSTDGSDGTWTDFGSSTPSNALLLSNASWVRYAPDTVNGETATLTFHAWDGTTGTASSTGSPSTGNPASGGGTSSYSSSTAQANLIVTEVNDAPTITLTPTVLELLEDVDTSSPTVVATISIEDDSIGTNTLSLSGSDAGLFDIVGGDLRLIAGASLDFESNPALDVTVEVDDTSVGAMPDDSASHSVTIRDINEAPSISLTSIVSTMPENTDTSSSILVATLAIVDDAIGTNVLSLSGVDASLFELLAGDTELHLRAGVSLDFLSNPSLDVTISVEDSALAGSPDDAHPYSITVTEVNSPATISLTPILSMLSEGADTTNSIKVADITVTDDGTGTNIVSLSGADQSLFELRAGDTELHLRAGVGLDFETNPTLDVTVQVDDALVVGSPDDFEIFSMNLIDANDAPTITLTSLVNTLPEDADTTSPLVVATVNVLDDAIGSNTISLSGADAHLFELNGNDLRLASGAILDYETNPTLDVSVNVDDSGIAGAPEDSAIQSISVADANDAPTLKVSPVLTEITANANTTSSIKVANLSLVDDAIGTNVVTLSGSDSMLFELRAGGTELHLRSGVSLDVAEISTLEVIVNVNDVTTPSNPDVTQAISLTLIPNAIVAPPPDHSHDESRSESSDLDEEGDASTPLPSAVSRNRLTSDANPSSTRQVSVIEKSNAESDVGVLLSIIETPSVAQEFVTRGQQSDSGYSERVAMLNRTAITPTEPFKAIDYAMLSNPGVLWEQLDSLQQSLSESTTRTIVIGSVSFVSTGFTVGYVAWILRGGALLSSLMASAPVWRFVDPLVIMAHTNETDDNEDGGSLESIVNRDIDAENTESAEESSAATGRKPTKS